MKIHLPINLRKALLTAVFAVSAVAPQAQAALLPSWAFDALGSVLEILTEDDYDDGTVSGYIDNRIDSLTRYDYCRSLSFFNGDIYAYHVNGSVLNADDDWLYVKGADFDKYCEGNGQWDNICAWDYLGPEGDYGYDEDEDYKRTNNVEIGYCSVVGYTGSLQDKSVSIQVNEVLYASKDIIVGDGSSVTGGTAEIYAGNNISGGEGGSILLGKNVKMEGKDMVATKLITTTQNFVNSNSADNIVIDMTKDVMSGGDIILDGNNHSVSAGGSVLAYGVLTIGTNSKIEAGADIVTNGSIRAGAGTTLSAGADISSVQGSIDVGADSVLQARGFITSKGDFTLGERSSATAINEGIGVGGKLSLSDSATISATRGTVSAARIDLLGGNTVEAVELVTNNLNINKGVTVKATGDLSAAVINMYYGNNTVEVGGSATTGSLDLFGTNSVKIDGDWTATGSVWMIGSDTTLKVGGALSATGAVNLFGNASVGKSLQSDSDVFLRNIAETMTLVNHLKAGTGLEITNTEIGTGGDTTVARGNMSLKHTADEGKTSLTTSILKVTQGNLSVDKAEVGAANVTVGGDAAIQNGASLVSSREMAVGGALMVDAAQVGVNVMDGLVTKSLTAQSLDVEKGMVRVYGNAEIQGSAQVSGKSDFRASNKKYELEITSKLSVGDDLSVDSGARAFVGNTLSVGGTLSVSGEDTKLIVADGTTADMLYVGSQGTVQLCGNAKNNVSKVALADGTLKLLTDGELAPYPTREYDLALQSLSVAGQSFMEANLIVGAGSELTFAQDSLLTMGCTVTIGSGTALNIESPLEYGVAVVLMDSVEGLTLAGNTVTADGWYDANGILTTINGEAILENDQYFIGYHNGEVSIKSMIVPEPATATLSLLALAALAARRRRK